MNMQKHKIIKTFEKDGNTGILQSTIESTKIKFAFTIRKKKEKYKKAYSPS